MRTLEIVSTAVLTGAAMVGAWAIGSWLAERIIARRGKKRTLQKSPQSPIETINIVGPPDFCPICALHRINLAYGLTTLWTPPVHPGCIERSS